MLGLLFWNKKEEESGKRFSFVCLLFFFLRGMESGRLLAVHLAGRVDISKRTYW